jgi:Uma2 family endonuclease
LTKRLRLIEKLAVYRQIPFLEEYFVISQNAKSPRFLFCRRSSFEPEIHQSGPITFESIALTLQVSDF